jgi:uncharacterized membrane-anchored protein YitT (DUF2179 family)
MQQAELIRVGLASRLPRTPRTSVANVSASSSNDLSLRDGGCVAVMPMFIWTSTIMRIIEDYPLVNIQKNTLLRVIPTMTFIHFVTGKSSGISSGILSAISHGILSGISTGILYRILTGLF